MAYQGGSGAHTAPASAPESMRSEVGWAYFTALAKAREGVCRGRCTTPRFARRWVLRLRGSVAVWSNCVGLSHEVSFLGWRASAFDTLLRVTDAIASLPQAPPAAVREVIFVAGRASNILRPENTSREFWGLWSVGSAAPLAVDKYDGQCYLPLLTPKSCFGGRRKRVASPN
jgi:hypothetical protein